MKLHLAHTWSLILATTYPIGSMYGPGLFTYIEWLVVKGSIFRSYTSHMDPMGMTS